MSMDLARCLLIDLSDKWFSKSSAVYLWKLGLAC